MIKARSLTICALAILAVVSPLVPDPVAAQGADTRVTALPATTTPAAQPAAAQDPDQQALKLFKPVEQIARQWIARPEIQRSLVGLEIMDIPSGRVLYSHNGSKRFVSASIAKVFTCACAYDLFGADYRYKTSLYGYGEIHNSKLSGPLIVMPSQDPSFSTNSLNSLVSQLATRVKSIGGGVQVGQVPGGGDFFATEWLIQDWGQDWMPASSDFVIDRNVALMNNMGRGYPLKTSGSDSESLALTRSLLKGPWASAWVTFNKSNGSVTFHRPDGALQNEPVVANPTEYNAAIVRSVLKSNGITLSGKDVAAVGSPIVLAQDVSPPLSEIAKFCLEHSDNLYAQQLLRTIGTMPVLNSKLENASLEDRGLARMSNWLQTKCSVAPSEAILFDGCGLSRKDAVTPHSLNMVLRYMGGTTANSGFLALMKHDFDPSAKSFKYKTGAMDSVRSVSGVVRTSTGQPLAVTAIVNAHTPSVRELKTTLVALVSRIESLGALKLKPAVQKQPARAAQRRSGARRTTVKRTRRARH